MNHLNICTYDNLIKGCTIASIAHAIIMRKYPDLSNEQSWDDRNYSIQNGEGIRATISFSDDFCVAAIRDEKSRFVYEKDFYINLFKETPEFVHSLAQDETLQYLLDNFDGEIVPVITVAFWCDINGLHSNQTYDEMMLNGFRVITPLIIDMDSAIEFWKNNYNMDEEEVLWLRQIYNIKVEKIFSETIINYNQIIDFDIALDKDECKISFEEMKIYFKT